MSLVHASILPDSQSLIETEGSFREAIRELEGELYFMQPDVLVILHSLAGLPVHPGIEISIADTLEVPAPDGEQSLQFRTDIEIAMHCKRAVDESGTDHTSLTDTQRILNHAAPAVRALTAHLQNVNIVDIGITPFQASFVQEHAAHFGQLIGREFLSTNKRVAMVAIGNFGAAHDADGLYSFARRALENRQLHDIGNYSFQKAQTLGSTIFEPLVVFAHAFQSASGNHTIMMERVMDNHGYMVVNSAVQ